MDYFLKATSLTQILEESRVQPVIIFKFSSKCGSSTRLFKILEKKISEKILFAPVYKIIVQKQPVLSTKIAEWFNTKHESPQIFILNKGKVTYTAHHNNINIKNFIFIQ